MERRRIEAALDRMRHTSGSCVPLAQLIALLLERGRAHLFNPIDDPEEGAIAPFGAREESYLLISREFVTRFFDASHRSANIDSRGIPRPETLQQVLAHEADHMLGRDHIDQDGYLTMNTMRCGDVGG